MNSIRLFYGLWKARNFASKSPDAIHKKQEKKLRKLLSYAYAHSPFYQEKFSKAGIKENQIKSLPITSFPTTNKEEVTFSYSKVLTVDRFSQEDLFDFDASKNSGLFQGRYHLVHSSGSTGKPIYFVYDKKAWDRLVISGARSIFWEMSYRDIFHLLKKRAHILYVAVSGERFGGAMMVKACAENMHAELLTIDVNEPFANWKQKAMDFLPDIIIGYPSAILLMTQALETSGLSFSIQRIISCGECLSYAQRKHLENYYHAPLLNFYAATESLVLGAELHSDEGMFLFDDNNLIEVIDGKMYLTNLYNFAQPLIRYQLSDSLELVSPMEKRYGFTRCKMKQGRADDILWFKDEKTGKKDFLHPTLLEDFCLEGLLYYQFIQETPFSFRVDFKVAEKKMAPMIEKNLRKEIQSLLDRHGLNFVSFKMKTVDQILPDPKSGKIRLCIALTTI